MCGRMLLCSEKVDRAEVIFTPLNALTTCAVPPKFAFHSNAL